MGSNRTPSLPRPTTAAGADGLAALLAAPGKAVVALDFDGTLAEIVPDPEQARAHPDAVPALAALAPHLASVVVITGRPAAVAVEYGGFAGVPGLDGLVVLGHYGAERWDADSESGAPRTPPPHPGVAAARAELPDLLGRFAAGQDVRVEDKGHAFAVHTRRAAEPVAAFDALRPPLEDLAARHGLLLEPGRMVLELRPPGMDKGVALTAFAREKGAETVVYAGDDLGDLAAYDAVDALRSEGRGGLLVSSGAATPELTARADLALDGPADLAAFLAGLAARLGGNGR
ncbi:trehalose-phosphatase [Streptomyces montanisoli]|uniref:Trehalose 6-phosphate phosphatase n=1 Tax=Streptomyces montanisoli TaxID=2798581 RepID=A0A940MAJ9_9ACTN|nr:trehalose-phosphatase [Streptomyces montanisoli]MBP0457412.1 trehalose-phosphatase [Streptomyces montanisoli]